MWLLFNGTSNKVEYKGLPPVKHPPRRYVLSGLVKRPPSS